MNNNSGTEITTASGANGIVRRLSLLSSEVRLWAELIGKRRLVHPNRCNHGIAW